MGKLDDLEKLQKLKESGALTEDEFKIEKQKILNSDFLDANKKEPHIKNKENSHQVNKNSLNNSNKSDNPIKIKFSTCLIIVLIVFLVFIGLIKVFTQNSILDAAKKAKENTSKSQEQEQLRLQNSEPIVTEKNTKNLSSEDVQVDKKFTDSSSMNDATSLVCTIAWEPIKSEFPNAKWNYAKILLSDGYGRFIVEVNYVRSSVSERADTTYVYLYVKDFEQRLGINLMWGPDYTFYTKSYNWGSPLEPSK